MSAKAGGKTNRGGAGKTLMTQERASAIQSRTAKTTGTVEAGTFAARAMAAGARNVNAGIVPAPSGKK